MALCIASEVQRQVPVLVGLAFAFSLLLNGSPSHAQAVDAPMPLRYTLSFEEARSHYVAVELRVPAADDKSVDLMMATWTPGSYLIREYARQIDEITAMTVEGQPLPIEKTSKNRWRVTHKNQSEVVVKYRVYCRELSVRTNFIDREFAVLNGAPTFITAVDGLDLPHWISIRLPENWKQSVTALDLREGAGAGEYVARNFDHLVDSPILVGNPEIHSFTVGDHEHQLVNLGGNGLWDGDKATKDVSRIVAEQHRLWGKVPYRRYLFLNVIAESGGGLEHDESTLMLTSRWSFRNEEDYQKWLGLVSHEFFHAWNIRTLRPRPLVQYDYEVENYFPSLWIAEGITSYYDDLSLVRAGVIKPEDYLKLLSKQIERLQETPGRLTQSLTDSSHDAWIKYYRQDEHSRNAQISYYIKGAVVGFLLDVKIREATSNEKSLDDVMREMYRRFSGPKGYTEQEFRQVAGRIAGQDLSAWFAEHVDSASELDYEATLSWLGLELDGRPVAAQEGEEAAPVAEGAATGEAQAKPKQPWTGATTKDTDGRLIVTGVQSYSPAYAAGINVDDELIAVNRFRVSGGNLDKVLQQFGAEATVTVTLARRGALEELELTLQEKPSAPTKVTRLKEPTEAQQANFKDWLKLADEPK